MKKSATPSGVPASNAAAQTNENMNDETREPTARELAMEAIAGVNDERIAQEIVDNGGSDPRMGVTTGAVDEHQDDQLTAQMNAPKVIDTGLDKMMVKIKIDGIEHEVSVEEMQRQYQKNGAADKRLAEATQLLREAKETARNPAYPPVGFESGEKVGDSTSTDEAKPSKDGKDFLSALFEGDEEKALVALEKLGLGRPSGSTQVDMAQLTAQLTPAIKQQLIDESALEKFGDDFADIVSDPHLADMADRFLVEEMAGGKTIAESLETAGTRTRDWLTSKGVAAPTTARVSEPNPTTVRDRKLERKAGIDVIPALNSKATVPEEPVQTPSDIIADMRKARGLEA